MKLLDCIELGCYCGLETVRESLFNIQLHSPSLCAYDKTNDEIKELNNEILEFRKTYCDEDGEKFENMKNQEVIAILRSSK